MKPGIWIARAVALVGFADAAYLTATHYAGAPVFCGASGGCDAVLTSAFATLGPVPIALLGAIYYGLASLVAWTPVDMWSRRTAAFLAALTGLALVVSGILILLQALVIEAWCRYCLVSAAITILLFLTALVVLRAAQRSTIAGEMS
jgi:uncharacterized membrane protein